MLARGVRSGIQIVRNASNGKAYVIGVGMTKFEKPGRREDFDYPDMAREAGQRALEGSKYDQDWIILTFLENGLQKMSGLFSAYCKK